MIGSCEPLHAVRTEPSFGKLNWMDVREFPKRLVFGTKPGEVESVTWAEERCNKIAVVGCFGAVSRLCPSCMARDIPLDAGF